MEARDDVLHGGCLCGAVRFEVRGEPLWSHRCHCSRCRKSTGSAFYSGLFVKPEALRHTQGQDRIRHFRLPGSGYSHAFCQDCGSSVPAVKADADARVRGIPMGALDDDPHTPLAGHIYVGSKASWYDIHDDAPQAEEMPDPTAVAHLAARLED